MGNDIFKENNQNKNEEIEEKQEIERQKIERQKIENERNQKFLKDIEKIFDWFLSKNSFQIFDSIDDVLAIYDNEDENITNYYFYKYFPHIKDNSLLISNYSHNFSMDILCAIYCTTDLTIDIFMDNKFILRQSIPAGNYYMSKCGPILISKLDSWPILKIVSENPGKIHFVYGIFSINLRNFIRNNVFYTSYVKNNKNVEDLAYKHGRIYLNDDAIKIKKIEKKEGRKIIKIPEFYLKTEEYSKMLANKVTENIKDELLEVAMHPDRLESFMSIDEIKLYLR